MTEYVSLDNETVFAHPSIAWTLARDIDSKPKGWSNTTSMQWNNEKAITFPATAAMDLFFLTLNTTSINPKKSDFDEHWKVNFYYDSFVFDSTTPGDGGQAPSCTDSGWSKEDPHLYQRNIFCFFPCSGHLSGSVPTATTSSSTKMTPTPNPTPTPSTPACDDTCKLNKGNRCNCNENGCDDSSPSCCAGAVCPVCNCTEGKCTPSSPSCCASGTCAWSWTGGGGGSPAQGESDGGK
jgi:hypothetical protein